jgi:small subunit ribosomal protein S8
MVKDSIANLINGLKLASKADKDNFIIPYSKMLESIVKVLKQESFIDDYSVKGDKKKDLVVKLKFEDGEPTIVGTRRISKQSKRIYKPVSKITSVKGGYKILVMTTPKGVMTDKVARKLNVGGEALFEIW